MTRSEAGKLGAQVSGPRLREKARLAYYENPTVCKECRKVIEIPEGKRPSDARAKKFCNQVCSARYNNKNRAKPRLTACETCGKDVPVVNFYERKFCDKCYKIYRRSRRTISKLTKGQARKKYKVFHNFKTMITGDANRVYKQSGKPLVCKVCSYGLHVEICHIKDVKDFPDTALIEEINHPTNLVALCRNHHWEFDNGHITL